MSPVSIAPQEVPSSRQLELFQMLTPAQHGNTIDLLDSIPKYEYRLTKAEGTYLKKRAFKLHNQVIRAEIKPAILGTDRAVFPGEREEAVEMTLRYLIKEENAERKKLVPATGPGLLCARTSEARTVKAEEGT